MDQREQVVRGWLWWAAYHVSILRGASSALEACSIANYAVSRGSYS